MNEGQAMGLITGEERRVLADGYLPQPIQCIVEKLLIRFAVNVQRAFSQVQRLAVAPAATASSTYIRAVHLAP